MENNLSLEQEKELFDSLKTIGYRKLTGDQRTLFAQLKVKFGDNSVDDVDDNSSEAVNQPEQAKQPKTSKKNVLTTGGSKVNPFKRVPKKNETVKNVNIDQSKSYIVLNNILSGGDFYKKGELLSGGHPDAIRFLREGLIVEFEAWQEKNINNL